MSTGITQADAYFASTSHVEASTWASFEKPQREGALAQAKRLLTAFKGKALDEDTTTDEDMPREDVAVYETALHILKNSEAVGNGDLQGTKVIADDNEEEPRERDSALIPSIAWFWMGRQQYPVRMYRG